MNKSNVKDYTEKWKEIDIYTDTEKWVVDEETYGNMKDYLFHYQPRVITIDESLFRSPIYHEYLKPRYKNIVRIIPSGSYLGFGKMEIEALGRNKQYFSILKKEKNIHLSMLDYYVKLHANEITHLIMSSETVADIAQLSDYIFCNGISTLFNIPIAICDANKPGIINPVFK